MKFYNFLTVHTKNYSGLNEQLTAYYKCLSEVKYAVDNPTQWLQLQ